MESGQVDGCGLLVAGGDPAPLFEAVDAPLDGVALLVGLAVEGRRPASAAALSQPVASLVRRDRDHRPDAALAQVFPDRAGRIGLVGKDHVRPGAGSSARPGNAQAGHDVREGGRIPGLPGGEMEGRRPTAVIGGKVDLRGQSAAGAANGVVVWFAGRGPFLRAPAACWWARTIVESTETAQLRSSSASAWAISAVNTRSQVPSTAHMPGLNPAPPSDFDHGKGVLGLFQCLAVMAELAIDLGHGVEHHGAVDAISAPRVGEQALVRTTAVSAGTTMESFFSLLQKNVLDRRSWATREELRIAIVTWIERTYHRRRRQASLGRLTPVEFETVMTTPALQAA
ncbi:transposase subunit [Streptomyces lincolnensis]|uniref:Transposase subunit n=1 Tax=Streptomyces lincolnensis TaxID=1915 RepID=A0A1B1MPY7_STRLN|nr:transposase subunit [Streptomyces lincolnensis]